MAGAPGRSSDNIEPPIERLSSEIGKFDFVSALRWLDCAFPEKPRLGKSIRISDESVRLSQSVSMAFQGVPLQSLEQSKNKHPWRLTVNFLGLMGVNGPLPVHYTEYADQRLRHHADPTFREFIDIFNHRMLSLFYRAMTEFDPAVNFDRPQENQFNIYAGALSGLALSSAQSRDSIPDYIKYYQATWFGSKAKSPDGIKSIIREYFDLPVDVQEFVGCWLDLPPDSRSVLGGDSGNVTLGVSAYVGKRVWSIGQKFKVVLGPLEWDDYLSFKPGGPRARQLYELIRNYTGDEWDWDLELQVEDEVVDRTRLDRTASLGFSSWLLSKAVRRRSQSNTFNKSVVNSTIQ